MDNNTTPQKTSNKKTGIKVLCVVLALAVCVAAGTGIFLVLKNNAKQENIVEALADGKYSQALELYEDNYAYGESDSDLKNLLEERLVKIEDEFLKKRISYNSAMKEIETIRAMGIEEIEEAVSKTESYIKESENGAEKEVAADSQNVKPTEAVTLREAPDVQLGSEPLPQVSSSPIITSASTISGSVLSASNVNAARSFGANKAIDGYYDSCWCVNTNVEGGAGGAIRFKLAQRSTVSGVMLVNGNLYMPYDELYAKNGQIKTFTLSFSDGTSQTFTASYNSSASDAFQTFYLDKPVVTDYITLTVKSGYTGYKFTTNVCLGEFEAF